MSDEVREVNEFFRYALRDEIDDIVGKLSLTERQLKIFDMKYIKGHDINYIADTLGSSPDSINKVLKAIRIKIIKVIRQYR